MHPPAASRPALSSAATLLLVACESHRSVQPSELESPPAGAVSSYFPPAEADGGWRKRTITTQIRELGLEAAKLNDLGDYLMSQPYENYQTGVSGYKPSNKAAIVVKDGWIVGEYYNQSGADKALYYVASNGKTLAMLLTGHMVQANPHLGLGAGSKLYDRRWLPEGSPLSDPDKSVITFDQVFRHAVGHNPRGRAPDRVGGGPDGSRLELRALHGRQGRPVAPERQAVVRPRQAGDLHGKAYSSVAFNHFSLIFENISGLEASEYLKRAMLGPIGVGRVAYRTTAGMGGTKWAAAGNGLMGARDFMRVGYLMLREGDWNGGRIFPASWIRRFTGSTAYQNLRSNRDCYWGSKYPADLYRTTGSGQNWVLVVPSLDLLLTYNGRTPASRKAEIDRESLERLFDAVTDRYVACDGTVVNGGG